jgi:cation diffusion facilitator family transporter
MVNPMVDDRFREVRRVILGVLLLNLLVAGAKAVWGLWAGSLALTSDAIHSSLDASSNLIGLAALRIATRPPDDEHPYGHGNVEVVTAALVGVVIAATALRFGWSAIEALAYGAPPPITTATTYAVVVMTLAVNTVVALWENRRGRALGSHFLVADAMHTASDVLVTLAVLASLILTDLGLHWADPVATLIVVVIIGRVAWRILRDNLGVLLDHAMVPAERVVTIATAVPGVRDAHRVRSRGVAGAIRLDLHLQVDGEMSVAAAHALAHQVEDRLRAELPAVSDVTIHVEPDDDPPDPL